MSEAKQAKQKPVDLGPIRSVSPFIRLSRWTFFTCGLFWGYKRYYANKAVEDEIRAYQAKMKPIWDAQKAALKAKLNREQMISLGKSAGVPIKKEMHDEIHRELLKDCILCK